MNRRDEQERQRALVRRIVLQAFDGEYTADEIAAKTGLDKTSVRPRITDLRGRGLLIPTTKKRPTPLGGEATVWRRTFAHEQAELPLGAA